MSIKKKDTQPPFVDPMAEREAQRYARPVPSREAVMAYLERAGEPCGFDQLCRALGVSAEEDQTAFARRLRAMERDGQLLKNRRGRYGLATRMELIRGRVIGHPDGFGFLRPDDGGEDLYVPPREMRQVLHGDRVMARVTGIDRRGRREAAIVEVLERGHRQVVGRLVEENRMTYVVPDDSRISQDILIPPEGRHGARSGQIVVARITVQPDRRNRPVGEVVEVLGDHMAPGMEVEIAIRKYELPVVWPDAVASEARAVPREVPAADKQGREDLRALPLVTIDGADARDFDDAVYCTPKGRGFRLIVAIADVSHYVRDGSALDAEAYQRGNSVYFPDRVIPMLPEVLSNGLCSLNPEVDRLCMACEMDIGPRGKIKRYRFFPALMRSHARLTYDQAYQIVVARDEALRRRHAGVVESLDNLYRVYKVLHAARVQRGAVDLDLPETRIVYGPDKRIERIEPVVRHDAHRLIEECMLAANVCAAEFATKKKAPILYRVHEGPSSEKIEDLRRFLAELGLKLGGGRQPSSKDYAKLIAQIEDRPDKNLVHTVLLRSFSQAVYSPDNQGHFALGYPHYAHFTSPIRRYPDLLLHRTLKAILARRAPKKTPEVMERIAQQGEHCSMTERRADEATRDAVDWLKAEYMMDKVGEVFEGIISGVTSFGIFVTLKEVYAEGLVHITALGNDYYHFDPVHHRLTGERSGQVYRLGDGVRVRVARVDLDEARIDFELAHPPTGGGRRRRAKTGAARGKKQGAVSAKNKKKKKQAAGAPARGGKGRAGGARRGPRRKKKPAARGRSGR